MWTISQATGAGFIEEESREKLREKDKVGHVNDAIQIITKRVQYK